MKTVQLKNLLQTAEVGASGSNKCHVELGGATRVHLTCTATAFVSNFTALLPSEQESLIDEVLKELPRPGSAFELVDGMPDLAGKKGAFIVRLEDDKNGTINLLVTR